jgi:hypothetical protein
MVCARWDFGVWRRIVSFKERREEKRRNDGGEEILVFPGLLTYILSLSKDFGDWLWTKVLAVWKRKKGVRRRFIYPFPLGKRHRNITATQTSAGHI